MGIIINLIGIVILFSIASTIYVEGDSQLTIENAKEIGHKILDTIQLWRS